MFLDEDDLTTLLFIIGLIVILVCGWPGPIHF